MSRVKKSFWLVLKPIRVSTGLSVEMHFCSANNANATKALGLTPTTYPYILSEPTYEINVFEGDFNGTSSVTINGIEISNTRGIASDFDDYVWDGCEAIVYSGLSNASTFGELTPYFSGVVEKSPVATAESVGISLTTKMYLLDKTIFTSTYLGTGGMEATAEMEGKPKPFAMGYPLNVVPVLIDPAFLIYQYHGYGAAGGVLGLYENGLSFGAGQTSEPFSTNNITTFTNLRNRTLAAGQWVDCPSLGMFRLGGEPLSGGVISADVAGHNEGGVLTFFTSVVQKLVTEAGQSALMDGSTFTGFQTAIYNQTLADYYEDPINAKEVIERYLSHVGGYSFINSAGKLRFGLVRLSTPSLTIRTDGTTSPVVEDGISLSTSAPYSRVKMGADKVFKVHALNEISDALYQQVFSLNVEIDAIAAEAALAASDSVLTIDEKIRILKPANDRLINEYTSLSARATALSIPQTNLINAYNSYVSLRNALSPAWDNITVNTTGINPAFRTSLLTLANEIILINKRISEEDAKRADWPTVGGRPPLLTGESVTVDEFLRDPSVWEKTSNDDAYFTVSGGEGLYSTNAGGARDIFHKPDNLTPIDPNATYEVSIEVLEEGAGAGTGRMYLGVQVVDGSNNQITGDGSFWRYYHSFGLVPAKGTWYKYSERIGKGTLYPFPANAVKFGSLALLNYTAVAGVIQRVRRIKSRRISEQSWTSVIPNAWTLGDGKIINNVRTYTAGSWNQTAFSKAAIKGPQRFSFRFARSAVPNALMVGLSELSSPSIYSDGVVQFYHTGAANQLQVYEAGAAGAFYNSETALSITEYALEYDGLFIKLLRNGADMGYSKFVGPDKTYRAFVDVTSENCGITDAKHASTKSLSVVGSDTFDSRGSAWIGENLGTRGSNRIFNGDAQSGLDGWIIDPGAPAGTFFNSSLGNAIGGSTSFHMQKSAVGNDLRVVGRAIPVIPGQVYTVRLKDYAGVAASTGYYIRFNQIVGGAEPDYVRDGNASSITDLVSNGATFVTITNRQFTYTVPAGVTWVSPTIISFIGAPTNIVFDDFSMELSEDFAQIIGATKPENNATVGARVGVNTRDGSGNLLGDADLRNNQINVSPTTGQFINPVGSGNGMEVSNSRLRVRTREVNGRGYAQIFANEGNTFVSEEIMVPAIQNVDQQWGQVNSRPVELTDGRIPAGLDSSGYNQIGIRNPLLPPVTNTDLIAGATGTQLNVNPEFVGASQNGYSVYNNVGGTKTTLSVIADASAPNSSGYILNVYYDGTGIPNSNPTPGYGGFTILLTDDGGIRRQGFYSKGTTLIYKFWVYMPAGRTFGFASNPYGSDGSSEFLTSTVGTGSWQQIIMRQKIGTTGTFSSTGFFFVDGGSNVAFSWYIAKMDVIDVSSSPATFLGRGGLIDELGNPLFNGNVRNSDMRVVADTGGTGGRARTRLFRDGGGTFVNDVELPAIVQNIDQQWNDVLGVSKPADYATSSDNLVKNGSLLNSAQYWTRLSSTLQAEGAASPVPVSLVFPATIVSEARANDAQKIPTDGSMRIWASGWIYMQAASGNYIRAGCYTYRPDDSGAGAGYIDVSIIPAATFQWVEFKVAIDLPANTTKIIPYIYSSGNSGAMYVGGLRFSKTEPAATVGATAGINLRKQDTTVVLDPDFLNNSLDGNTLRIPSPVGGALASEASAQPGALKIELPISNSDTMMRFFVDVYEYAAEASVTYEVGGYNYSTGNWIAPFASAVGRSPSVRTVRFGYEGGKHCIFIGELAGTWAYPKIRIRDFTAGYSNFNISQWKSGWVLSWKTTAFPTLDFTVSKPVSGDAIVGNNTRDVNGNVLSDVNLRNEAQRFDFVVPGFGKPENNATVGAAWGSNLSGRPVELTDGRIPDGLDASGDIRRALPVSTGFRQSSTITRPLPRGARVVNLRDGDNYTFPVAWGSGQIPSVQAYNNGYVDATNYLDIKALNLTSSGFTAEAKKVGPGTITPQSETTAGTPSAPRSLEIVKGLAAEAHNDMYTFLFNVRVNNLPDGEPGAFQPGDVTVGLWTYDGATWQLNSTIQYFGEGGTASTTTINGASGSVARDGMGTNDRFGLSLESGSGQILAFSSVTYGTTSGNTITSATPTNFPGIPFLILGGTEN